MLSNLVVPGLIPDQGTQFDMSYQLICESLTGKSMVPPHQELWTQNFLMIIVWIACRLCRYLNCLQISTNLHMITESNYCWIKILDWFQFKKFWLKLLALSQMGLQSLAYISRKLKIFHWLFYLMWTYLNFLMEEFMLNWQTTSLKQLDYLEVQKLDSSL